ncbi:MAG: CRISPR-associated RAMP family protein [Chloroflexota bacterium]|nr:MAG: CRISPR-associated RAMP family protein [Chloroflexota bacterium]
MLLKHTNPTQPRRDREGRTFWAHAPYNFVPLPERMVSAQALPDLDSYGNGLLTGRIECELETCSPLYVRGMMTPADYQAFGEKKADELTTDEKERRAPSYSTQASQIEGHPEPAIPGSSLRGMVRTLVEIIGFGRMRWVGKEPTFTFRAVAASRDDPLREPYRQVVGAFGRNVRAGYLVQRGENWFVQPALTPRDMGWPSDDAFLKVKERSISGRDLPKYVRLDDPNYRPQIHHVRFDVDIRRSQRGTYVAVSQLAAAKGSMPRYEGYLVCSGNMKESAKDRAQRSPRKSHALVLMPDERARALKIQRQAIDDYMAGLTPYQKEQLTAWSGDDKGSPNGCLYDLKPVFYVAEGNEVVHFGHSPNFRIPARLQGSNRAATPFDFVPDALRNHPEPDLADALFGWVEEQDFLKGQRAGRVFFEDARCVGAKDGVWLKSDPITPRVLSGPKVTTFQHYLVQDRNVGHDPDRKETLAHYGSPPNTTQIRGHKLYWHRGASPDIEATPKEREHEKQLTRIIPVKPGVRFKFTVHFENLRPEELGALWWALALPSEAGKEYRHKLGMGKPLGMGAVKITPRLFLSERRDQQGRYGKLFTENGWHVAEQPGDGAPYAQQFERYVLNGIGLPGATRLTQSERIRMLLTMLEWREGTEEWSSVTSYMEVEAGPDKVNEYKERPVLPDPAGVVSSAPTVARVIPGRQTKESLTTAARPQSSGAGSGSSGGGSTEKTGAVTRWVEGKGYGFIKPDGGGQDLFVHSSDVQGATSLQEGQRVRFQVVQGPKGPQARKVRPS